MRLRRLGIGLILIVGTTSAARAEGPPTAAIPSRHELGPRDASGGRPAVGKSSGWVTIGLTAAFAAVGLGVVAARRWLPTSAGAPAAAPPLKVVARAALSQRQAVLLVKVGPKTLILGVGPQGPPCLLGEYAGEAS